MRKLQEIYDDQNLTHRAKTVYLYLSDRADVLRKCWPSIGTIARELALSRSTVQRAIQDLREQGYLETQQRWRENGGKSSLLFRLQNHTKDGLRPDVAYGTGHGGMRRGRTHWNNTSIQRIYYVL